MALERTFSIVKPDGVARNLIGEVYRRFEAAGLKDLEAVPPGAPEEVKGEGRFEPHIEFAKNVKPAYAWWNGKGTAALLDQPVKPGANGKVSMYRPEGSIDDPKARISPFKYHTGKLPIQAISGTMGVMESAAKVMREEAR